MASALFKNVAWLSIGQLTNKVLRMFFVLFAARIVGVSEYGILGFALAQAGIFSVIADCGIWSYTVRECAKGSYDQRAHIVSNGFGLKCLLILSCASVLGLTLFFSKNTITLSYLTALFTLTIFASDSMKDYMSGVMISLEKTKEEALINTVTTVLLIIIGIPVLMHYKTGEAVLFLYAAASILSVFLEVVMLHSSQLFALTRIRLVHMLEVIKTSYIFGLQAVCNMLMFGLDTIMLGWFRGEYEIGLYAAAQKVPILLFLIPGYIAQGLYPELSRTSSDNPDRFREILGRTLGLLLLIAVPLCIGGEFVAADLLVFVFGGDYVGATQAFRIMLLICFFSFPISIFGVALMASHQQKRAVSIMGIATVASVIINALFIPSFGMNAAAVSLVIAQGMICVGFAFSVYKLAPFKLSMPFARTILSLALLVGAIVLLQHLHVHVLLVIAAAAIVYCVPLFPYLRKLGR